MIKFFANIDQNLVGGDLKMFQKGIEGWNRHNFLFKKFRLFWGLVFFEDILPQSYDLMYSANSELPSVLKPRPAVFLDCSFAHA